jgi:hypothetical protein
MKLRVYPPALLAVMFVLPGCQSSSGPGGAIRFNPPNTEFATRLGIAPPPPVTQEQAMAIAAQAAGGTALSASSETEAGQMVFEVKVETPSGRKEVEVRASDGGVVGIEPDDSD